MNHNKPYKIINGDSLQVLDTFNENSIDAIITDPPYELGFMGKKWDDTGIAYNVELWQKALKVLKPGGYLLAFGGSRTFHRIACTIEDGGFEIRDTIMWLYGSGFPKSLNIGLAIDKKKGVESIDTGIASPNARPNSTKENTLYEGGTVGKEFNIKKATNEWDGWGTCLKPAFEPIIVARKPVEKSVADNVLKYGVGGINIDECRVPFEKTQNAATNPLYRKQGNYKLPEKGQKSNGAVNFSSSNNDVNELGRFPSNIILTYDETDKDEVCGGMPDTKSTGGSGDASKTNTFANVRMGVNGTNTGAHLGGLGDEGSAARYFYCAKASKKDRDSGLILLEEKSTGELQGGRKEGSAGSIMKNEDGTTRVNPYAGTGAPKKNIHPTVKPVELMQYLVRLVSPKGATILDIFNGSGSTGKAVAFENRERNANYKYIGIELDGEYCKISESRIDYALNKFKYDVFEEIEENEKKGQLSLFDFEESDGGE